MLTHRTNTIRKANFIKYKAYNTASHRLGVCGPNEIYSKILDKLHRTLLCVLASICVKDVPIESRAK